MNSQLTCTYLISRTHSSSELCFAANLWSEVKVCSPAVRMWTSLCLTHETLKKIQNKEAKVTGDSVFFNFIKLCFSNFFFCFKRNPITNIKPQSVSILTVIQLEPSQHFHFILPFVLVSDFSQHKLEKLFFQQWQIHFEETRCQTLVLNAHSTNPSTLNYHVDASRRFHWSL